jgi:hypothetical protein
MSISPLIPAVILVALLLLGILLLVLSILSGPEQSSCENDKCDAKLDRSTRFCNRCGQLQSRFKGEQHMTVEESEELQEALRDSHEKIKELERQRDDAVATERARYAPLFDNARKFIFYNELNEYESSYPFYSEICNMVGLTAERRKHIKSRRYDESKGLSGVIRQIFG